jgi:hypothetical protein
VEATMVVVPMVVAEGDLAVAMVAVVNEDLPSNTNYVAKMDTPCISIVRGLIVTSMEKRSHQTPLQRHPMVLILRGMPTLLP